MTQLGKARAITGVLKREGAFLSSFAWLVTTTDPLPAILDPTLSLDVGGDNRESGLDLFNT